MNRIRAKSVSLVLSGVLSIGIVIAAIYYRKDIGEVIRQTDFFWVAAGALCYGCNYFCRSWRLWMYTERLGALFPSYLRITGLHGFNSYFLPMRSGDLTLPFLLRLYADVPLTLGSRVLLRARMLDVSSLGYLLIFATLFTPSAISSSWRGLLLCAGMGFVAFPYVAVNMVRRGAGMTKARLRRIVGGMQPSYPDFRETVISLTIWFWIGCTIFCVIRSLDIPLSFYDVWFLVAIQLPLQILPVQGLANSGNHEVGWVFALSLLGVPPSQGLPMALASHVVFVLYAVLLGGMVLLLPSAKNAAAS